MSNYSCLNYSKQPTKKVGAVIIGGDFQGLGIMQSLGQHGIPTYLLDKGLCISRFSKILQKVHEMPQR